MSRLVLTLAAAAMVLAACGAFDGVAVPPGANPSASDIAALATPTFAPAPGSIGGHVVGLIPGGIVIESEGRPVEISLARVVDVWKETSVAPGALELGDRVFVNGTPGSPFIARYIWANIAQLDGVIRAIDATGMEVELRPGGGVERIEFSQYVQFGSANGAIRTQRSDLTVGREVGLVVYRPRTGPARTTRVW